MTSSTKRACGTCRKTVAKKGRGLECEGCDQWFHTECESVSVKMYELLKENDEISWHCLDCKNSIRGARNKVKELEMENRGLKELLSEMKATLKKELKEEILSELKLNKQDERERIKQGEEAKKCFLQIAEDIEEKKKRCENLVVFHLPESDNENPKKREDEDTGRMDALFKTVLEIEECEITKSIRLGKKNTDSGKPRPLLIKMRSEEQKWTVLKKTKLLRSASDAEHRQIFIVKDQTRKERELSKKRWMEKKSFEQQVNKNADPKNLVVTRRMERLVDTEKEEKDQDTRVS